MPDNVFEIADVMVALGGDRINTVPRYDVTAGEIAVLQVIHGNDAVFDVKPKGTIDRKQRVERSRLQAIYGHARDHDGNSQVERLYPGAAARVFERLDELILDESQFVATGRAGGEATTGALREAQADVDAGNALATGTAAPAPVAATVDAEEAAAGLDDLPADEPATGALN